MCSLLTTTVRFMELPKRKASRGRGDQNVFGVCCHVLFLRQQYKESPSLVADSSEEKQRVLRNRRDTPTHCFGFLQNHFAEEASGGGRALLSVVPKCQR